MRTYGELIEYLLGKIPFCGTCGPPGPTTAASLGAAVAPLGATVPSGSSSLATSGDPMVATFAAATDCAGSVVTAAGSIGTSGFDSVHDDVELSAYPQLLKGLGASAKLGAPEGAPEGAQEGTQMRAQLGPVHDDDQSQPQLTQSQLQPAQWSKFGVVEMDFEGACVCTCDAHASSQLTDPVASIYAISNSFQQFIAA